MITQLLTKFPELLWISNVYYHVSKNPQMNPVHTFTPNLFQTSKTYLQCFGEY
jgi:hypothetical protein